MNRAPLLTYWQLQNPILSTRATLLSVEESLRRGNFEEFTLYGHFVLLVASFEGMLWELVRAYVAEHPEKLSQEETTVSVKDLSANSTTTDIIDQLAERRATTISFLPFRKQLKIFFNTLEIHEFKDEAVLSQLNEAMERRNLLVHTNLRINASYLHKTGNAEGKRRGDRLSIDHYYVRKVVVGFRKIVEHTEGEVKAKYGGLTRVAALEKLWHETLPTPLTNPFEEFWEIDTQHDRLLKAKDHPRVGSLSSSERLTYDIWVSFVNGELEVRKFHPKSYTNHQRLLFLLEKLLVFGLETDYEMPV